MPDRAKRSAAASPLHRLLAKLIEVGIAGEVDDWKSEIFLYVAPSLGNDFMLHPQDPLACQLLVIAIADELHVDDRVAIMIEPRPDIDPDDIDSSEV